MKFDHGSPGLSRWRACRGRSLLLGKSGPAEAGTPILRCPDYHFNVHEPVDACRGRGLLLGKPGPAEAGTPILRCPDYHFNVHEPVDACRGRSLLLGKPGPAEAGTPLRRYLDYHLNVHQPVDACRERMKFEKIVQICDSRESRLEPVACLPGPGHTAGNARTG
jgi:hypothetical protein